MKNQPHSSFIQNIKLTQGFWKQTINDHINLNDKQIIKVASTKS